jgi:hypothetical protein
MKLVKTWTQFAFNGKDANTLEDLPDEIRKLLEEQEGPGLLDALRKAAASHGGFCVDVKTVNGATTYKVGDTEYHSLDELPAEVRALLTGRDGNGLAGFLQQVAPPKPAVLTDEAGCLEWKADGSREPRSDPSDHYIRDEPDASQARLQWGKLAFPVLVLLVLAGLALAYAVGRW